MDASLAGTDGSWATPEVGGDAAPPRPGRTPPRHSPGDVRVWHKKKFKK